MSDDNGLSTRVDEQAKRIDSIEDSLRSGHPCISSERISRIENDLDSLSGAITVDVKHGIRHGENIEHLKEDLVELKDIVDKSAARRRNSWILAVTMFFGFIGTLIGAVYGYGGLNSDIRNDRVLNLERHKQVSKTIEDSNKNTEKAFDNSNKQVELQIKMLRIELAKSNGHAERYESICLGMVSHEKRTQRIIFMRNKRRIPSSCL